MNRITRYIVIGFLISAGFAIYGATSRADLPPYPSFPAREASAGSCVLPQIMGDIIGRHQTKPDPTNDIKPTDARWILVRLSGLPNGNPCPPVDMDCDHDVDAVDALWILRWIAKLPYTQNEPCPDIGTILN